MKKINSRIIPMSAFVASLMLTSCIGDGPNKYSGSGFFTVSKTGTNYTLYADYGGVVMPTNSSVTELTSGVGFSDQDRVYLVYQYTDDNIKEEVGKGAYITEAELISGQSITKENILFKADAEAKKQLDADSVFTLPSNLKIGAYRGYLTLTYTGAFSIVDNKGIAPSMNVIFDPTESERPNEAKFQLVYNRHTAKDVQASSTAFLDTYPLSILSNFIGGKDSIQLSFEGQGLTKDISFKIGREDLQSGNYIYFQ